MITVWHTETCGELRSRLLDRLDATLGEIDAQIADLRAARNHVVAARVGLEQVEPDSDVPSPLACAFVRLLQPES